MNCKSNILVFLLFVIPLCNCKYKPKEIPLMVETTQINFSAEQNTRTISCPSHATIEAVSSQPAWCTVKVVHWNNSSAIEINVSKNTIVQERTATVTVTAEKADAVQIEVKQASTSPVFNVDATGSVLHFTSQASQQQLTVNANVPFTATTSYTWCAADIDPDATSGNVTVSVTESDKITERNAEVVIASPGFNNVSIRVVQDGHIPDRSGMNIKGWVSCNDTGIQGVTVSDGYEVTTTNADGVYYLSSQKRNGYVFISTPGNYETSVSGNIPQFFKRLKADVNTMERMDFELTAANNERYTVLAVTDFHLANRINHLEQFGRCLTDMNGVIDSYQSGGTKTYVLTMGDLSYDIHWYSTGYALPQYANTMKGFKTCVFNSIGNHDNDPYQVGDFGKQPFKDNIGPTWYSFNLGKAHYVVLDNVVYINNGGSQGVQGDRSYVNGITGDQIEWLKKDLATVADKSAPLIVAMHIQLYRAPNVNNSVNFNLSNGQQFVDCLSGFSNVHVLTGHTHYNFRLNPNSWLMEHNIGAICASWWYSGEPNYAGNHICGDGSVGGYGVYEMNGKDLKWYYKSVGYDRNYQFRTYDRNTIHITAERYAPLANATYAAMAPTYADPYHTANTYNEVLINVWGYDPTWKIEVTESTVSLPVTRVSTKDPLHIISCAFPVLNRNAEPTSTRVANTTSHIFKVTASSPTTTLNIKVTDRFGNVYTETMIRPKDFTLNMK